jgi:hypothetical protein
VKGGGENNAEYEKKIIMLSETTISMVLKKGK